MREFTKNPAAKKAPEKQESFVSTLQKLKEGKSFAQAKSPDSVSISGKKKSVK